MFVKESFLTASPNRFTSLAYDKAYDKGQGYIYIMLADQTHLDISLQKML